jgi:hypothetical protein
MNRTARNACSVSKGGIGKSSGYALGARTDEKDVLGVKSVARRGIRGVVLG